MTGNPVNRAARAAGRRLASTHGTAVEAQVEAALYAQGTERRQDQYFDPVALGSLIVSVATLAWTVYKDLRKTTPKPTRETIAERVRIELRATYSGPPAKRDDAVETSDIVEVIDIVVHETFEATED